jgi:hypothetical protein
MSFRDNRRSRLAAMQACATSLNRHRDCRERFIEAIDWTLMTDDDCFEARIREDELNDAAADLADELFRYEEMMANDG